MATETTNHLIRRLACADQVARATGSTIDRAVANAIFDAILYRSEHGDDLAWDYIESIQPEGVK